MLLVLLLSHLPVITVYNCYLTSVSGYALFVSVDCILGIKWELLAIFDCQQYTGTHLTSDFKDCYRNS